MPVKWRRQQIEKFIMCVQQHSCLYFVRSVEYLDRKKKTQAFQNILTQMQKDMSQVTLEDLKKKWKNLRTQYTCELRKGYHSKKYGRGDVHAPRLWCFEQLKFLQNHVEIRASEDNMKDRQPSFETNRKRESPAEPYDDEYIPYFKKKKTIGERNDRLSHKISEWRTEEIFSLINEFKQRKCLWDKLHHLYKRLDKRTEAFKEIAAKFNCQEKDVKEKLRNLRTNFMECLRKGKFGVAPRWQFYSALEFLNMESSTHENIDDMEDEDQSIKSYTESATPSAYYEATPAASIRACAPIDAMVQLPPHCSTAADSSYDIELIDNIKHECEDQSVISETESATLPMPAPMKVKDEDDSTTSNSCRTVGDEKGSNLRSDKHEMSNVTTTNVTDVNGQKYAKFLTFIASTMEVMQDPELEKLTELKIRMILAEMSHKAVKRQLSAFNDADNL